MSYFVFGKDTSYLDYLKSKKYLNIITETEHLISFEISKQTREMIATQDNLIKINIRISESLKSSEGFETLSYSLSEMMTDQGDITAKIHCAFGNLMIQPGEIKNGINEINTIAKQVIQTPTVKLFERARTAFNQGLYRESFEVLQNTMEISQKSSITKPGWQHYQMLGILYLGFADCDFTLIDLAQAESSFLKSAQLSKEENPYECAKAFMLAGWSAYCQGRLSEASEYAENSINMSRILAEAKFLMAKILIALNDIDKALVYLSRAIETDPFYAIKAAGEEDFQNNDDSLRYLLESVRDKYAFYLTNLNHDFDIGITDKNVVQILHDRINSVIEDKSLYSYVSEYRQLCKATWIISEGNYAIGEIRNVVVKQDNWYSNKVIEQVKDEYNIPFVNFSFVGNRHSIELTFTLNLIEYKAGNFYIGRTQVTQALWNIVMGHKGFPVQGANYPAYELNWFDCIRFCNKLNILLGISPYYHIKNDYNPPDWTKGIIECDFKSDGFRLPTEAEWEFAAKGGAFTHRYPYGGSKEPNDVAWYDKNSKSKIQFVAQKKPNELGLYDMSGNAWEWCWDYYNETDRRILRGGAFFSSASLCAVTGRGHASATNTGIGNGMRLVRNAKVLVESPKSE